MDKKAMQGHLIGYDGDERFRIWITESNTVVLSRDVQFEEKPGCCIENVTLPLQDVEGTKADQEDVEDQSASDEDTLKEYSLKDYETSTDTEFDDDVQKTCEEKPGVKLRDRSTLKRSTYFNEYVMVSEDFIGTTKVPETYEDALRHEESVEWKKAMDRVMGSLMENQTWELEDLPKGAKAIPCKWVFRLKNNADGSIDKYKARLVAKGFSQREGIDYNQAFSPVARMTTIRSILSVAASKGMYLAQFDVSTAFLYGELEETIYMAQPEGYEDGTNRVCKLRRSLYGLKQAPRCWNKRFGHFLLGLGFRVSQADPCLYVRKENGRELIIVLYVDDGLVAATNHDDLKTFFEQLKAEFRIKAIPATYFLGLQFEKMRLVA